MMKTAKIGPNRTIVLPKALFKPADKIVTFCEGNTFIVKKLNQPDVTEIASRTKEKPMPLREIVKEVHRYRREKRAAK
ncbi:MAG: hypothetical protein KJ569_05875 [Candidatus Omnitrophica bacterium]|nr:hypothetical protein [Candidatus Omnitrophota bacterium]MBU0896278.1 hypothetical protein [Candidatus Omnitrophota bacterium]MBU1134421.1 hypothetical protein [Candidatus Omnitrophota bacterium]MBU1367482.1 hypothetical protein [Candidatus Omnitrophota bacterium]MBU1523633.1 hypothetical protein [Candidatus Omnitrophota bacterium]